MERLRNVPVFDRLGQSIGRLVNDIRDSRELGRREKSVDWARRYHHELWSRFGGPDGRTVSLEQVKFILREEALVVRTEGALRDFHHGHWEGQEEQQLNQAIQLDTQDGRKAAVEWFTEEQRGLESWIKFNKEFKRDDTESRRRARACRTTIRLLQENST